VQVILLALCCAVTTGSVMSPIGNPQNLLVATYSGMENPFLSFALYLGIPTLISLAVTFLLIRAMYPKDFGKTALIQEEERITDPGLAALVRISLSILLLLIIARTLVSLVPAFAVISLPAIALLSALPILLFSRKRFTVLRSIDWHTLIFFVAMFVLMGSVWQSGIFQSFLKEGVPNSVPGIITISVILSQFVSNVPFVALFQPLLVYQGIPLAHILALAAGSTLAGNLTILGAASNVIVIQNAEKHGETITFLEFLKLGIPLTILQMMIFSLFLMFA